MNNKELKRESADYAIAGLSAGDSQEIANIKERAFRDGAAYGWKQYTDLITRLRAKPAVQDWELSFDRIYLHVLLTTNLVLSGMDSLETTRVYRGKLMDKGRTFIAEMKKMMDADLPLVMGVKDDEMYLVMEYQEQVVARLATLDFDSYGAVLEFLDKYRADPEGTLQRLDIQRTDNVVLAQQEYKNRINVQS